MILLSICQSSVHSKTIPHDVEVWYTLMSTAKEIEYIQIHD